MRRAVLLGLLLCAVGLGAFLLLATAHGFSTALGMLELFALPILFGALVLALVWALGGRS